MPTAPRPAAVVPTGDVDEGLKQLLAGRLPQAPADVVRPQEASGFTTQGRAAPRPLTAEERANAVRIRRTDVVPQSNSDLERIRAEYQVKNEAYLSLKRVQDAHQAKVARMDEFQRYEKAGMPNGPLTPQERQELVDLDAYLRSGVRDRLDRAQKAYVAGDYDTLRRLLK